jgi:hypothetical protein
VWLRKTVGMKEDTQEREVKEQMKRNSDES